MPTHTHTDLTDATPAGSATSAFGTKIAKGLEQFSSLSIHITSQGLTGGTLNIGLWTSFDSGATWYEFFRSNDIGISAALATVTVAASRDGAAATFSRGRSIDPAAPVPALAKGTTAPGLWGTWMKVCYELGAGVNNTAPQIVIVEGHR